MCTRPCSWAIGRHARVEGAQGCQGHHHRQRAVSAGPREEAPAGGGDHQQEGAQGKTEAFFSLRQSHRRRNALLSKQLAELSKVQLVESGRARGVNAVMARFC